MAVGDGLKQHRFSRSGRGDDETPLTLAEGRQQIHHPHGDVRIAALSGGHFQVYPLLGIKRGQVVEQDFAFAELRVLEIDGFNLEQREVALAFLGRPDMAGHRVPGPQIEPPDLGRRNIDVVRAGQVVVARGPEEPETVRQDFQDALAVDEAVLFGLGFQDFEDELLLAERARAHDIQAARDFGQIVDRLRLEIVQVEDRSLGLAAV